MLLKKKMLTTQKHLNWLFDFDPVEGEDTEELLKEFLADVEHYHKNTQTKRGEERPNMTVETHKTPNGYGVVVDQRFDTRELLTKWTNVELKRDDLLCVRWAENNQLTVDLENVQPSGPFTP